jgi:hypothetical protein
MATNNKKSKNGNGGGSKRSSNRGNNYANNHHNSNDFTANNSYAAVTILDPDISWIGRKFDGSDPFTFFMTHTWKFGNLWISGRKRNH